MPRTIDGVEWWPVEEVTTSPRGSYVQVLRDCYWAVNKDGHVALFRASEGSLHPQCNLQESMAKRIVLRTLGAVDYVKIPLAFSPIRIEDYR